MSITHNTTLAPRVMDLILLVAHGLSLLLDKEASFSRLLSATKCSSSSTVITLETNRFGVRGLFIDSSSSIDQGSLLLSVPLESCVHDLSETSSIKDCDWSVRLARELLTFDNEPIMDAWMELLPEPTQLQQTLPTHWPDDVLEATGLRSFIQQARNDRLSQKERITRLVQYEGLSNDETQRGFRTLSNILDLCNTRMCQVELDHFQGCILAPVFDMLNHAGHGYNNASYQLEKNEADDTYSLVVRAKRKFEPNEEILIDYGEGTRDLNCLHNYGFLIPSMIEAGAEIRDLDDNSYLLNFRQSYWGFGPDLVETAAARIKSSVSQSGSLGEKQAEWIIQRIDRTLEELSGSKHPSKEAVKSLEVESAVLVRNAARTLLIRCRDLLLADRIQNVFLKLKLTLSKPRV